MASKDSLRKSAGVESSVSLIPHEMIGKRFERLLVISEAERVIVGKKRKFYRRAFNCLCDCGNKKIVTQLALSVGSTRSCGCLHSEMMVSKCKSIADLWVGRKYFYLEVVDSIVIKNKHGDNIRKLKCVCVCGKTTFTRPKSKNALSGKSCGCLSSDMMRESKGTHGFSDKENFNNRAYRLYAAMTKRARDKNIDCDFIGKPIEFCEWFSQRIVELNNKCPVLGVEFVIGKGIWSDASASIDRVNVSYGYVIGNIEIISHRANQIKNDSSIDELRKLIFYMSNYEK